MLKLALRNLKSKPWRAVATVVGIAVAVAMIFAMLSFRGTVYDYIGASETAVAGASDVKIATQSSSDRITSVTDELLDVDGVKTVVPSLYLYATLGGEYVQARGFETGHLEELQKIDRINGKSIDEFGTDDVVISEKAAKHFGVKFGDRLTLSLGNNDIKVYVGAIVKNTGYFLADSPYLILGSIKQISGLVIPGEVDLCNEIYLSVQSGKDVNAVIDSVKAIPKYQDMRVELSHDYRYIDEQTTALTAPVVLAGAAVLVLAVVIVAFLFLMSEKDKVDYIARLRIVGATNEQIFGVFMIESMVLAFVGGLVGSALAVGVFALITRLTLKVLLLKISAVYLFVSAIIGIASALLSSLLPIVRSLKGTIRQNQTPLQNSSKFGFILPILLVVSVIVSVVVECTVSSLTSYFAVVSLVLTIVTLFVSAPYVLKGVSYLTGKASNPSVKTASKTLPREKRFARSTSILTVGIAISVMLFMAWNITTTVFNGYVKNFEDFVFVSNIKSTVNVEEIKQIDGVDSATKMVWQKSDLRGEGFEKTVNLLGSTDVLKMINFEFVSPKDGDKHLDELFAESAAHPNAHASILDVSLQKLYGVSVGDELDLTIKDKTIKVFVSGFVQHNLFNGNYIIVDAARLSDEGIEVDTVLAIADGDVDKAVGNIKQKYASQNYYVVSALEVFKWDKESTSAVFDLVGTLAVVVGLFILVVSVFAALVGRGTEDRARTAFLSAGMSKGGLLGAELFQHSLIALVSFALAFAASVLLTMSLIHALMLFGLYFEFTYKAWVVAVVGLAMSACYALVPILLNFKKGYKLTRN